MQCPIFIFLVFFLIIPYESFAKLLNLFNIRPATIVTRLLLFHPSALLPQSPSPTATRGSSLPSSHDHLHCHHHHHLFLHRAYNCLPLSPAPPSHQPNLSPTYISLSLSLSPPSLSPANPTPNLTRYHFPYPNTAYDQISNNCGMLHHISVGPYTIPVVI